MNRNTLIGFIALLVLIAGLVLYYGFTPSPAKAPTTGTSPVGNPYIEQTDQYEISASYPTTTPIPGDAGEEAAGAMQMWVIGRVSEFKELDFSILPDGTKATLDIRHLMHSSPRTVSYVFTTEEYTGGAHGMIDFKTFTFDKEAGTELALADLFAGPDYLARLSGVTRTTLAQHLGEYADADTIARGTEPTAENFENFFIESGTLSLLFPPYQVAAYAAGPQTVRIPLAEVADILKPEYRY